MLVKPKWNKSVIVYVSTFEKQICLSIKNLKIISILGPLMISDLGPKDEEVPEKKDTFKSNN